MNVQHASMRDMTRILSPTEQTPVEVFEHMKACPRCLNLFYGLTQAEEYTDILCADESVCPREPEVYDLYYGQIPNEDGGFMSNLQAIWKRAEIMNHIRKCEECTRFIEFLRMSDPLHHPALSPVRETARLVIDYVSAALETIRQPELTPAHLGDDDRVFTFRFDLSAQLQAVLTYTPHEGVLEISGETVPELKVYTDGVENSARWTVVEHGKSVYRFNPNRVNLLRVEGCPVIETVPYSVLKDQRLVLGNLSE